MEILKTVFVHILLSLGFTLFGNLISMVMGPVGVGGGFIQHKHLIKLQ